MKDRGFRLLIFLWMFLGIATQVGAAEWEYYTINKDGNSLFFDKSSISLPDNVIRVNQKEVYTTDNLFWRKKRLGKKFIDSKETITQIEVNCSNADYRVRMVTEYDSDGKTIDIFSYEKRFSWKPAVDYPEVYILYDLVCFSEWIYVTSSVDYDYFINKGALRVNNSNVNISFWMKEVDKKTGKETEKEKVTIVCEKDKYTLRHLMKYNPDGSVKEVLTDRQLKRWIPIKPKTIIDGFHEILCDDKYVRQNVKDYLKTVLK